MTTTLIATVGQKFSVAGMTCSHCELAVTAELRKLEGVTRVTVDVRTGTVITESAETLPIEAVAAAVDEAGYELVVR
jgi:copper chaperone CopZ